MAKLIGPALSIGAGGSLGQTVTFQKRPSGHACYLKSKPGRLSPWNPTAKQLAVRAAYAEAIAKWKELSTSEQQQWNDFLD